MVGVDDAGFGPGGDSLQAAPIRGRYLTPFPDLIASRRDDGERSGPTPGLGRGHGFLTDSWIFCPAASID